MAEETAPPVVDAELVEDESGAALAVAHPQALEAMERAQQDVMISCAKKYPRAELAVIRQRMLSFATIDVETAESCFYTLKRKDKKTNQTKLIQGPSIRLAEIALVCYQNIRAGSRVIANDGKKITSQGICFDAENNVLIAVEESRSILYSTGRPYSEDMQIVTGRANNAIARRNAILEVIPRVLTNHVYERAKEVAVGDATSLSVHRDKVLARFKQMGVSEDQILRLLEKESVEAIDLAALEQLIGLGSSLKDGVMTIEEAFAVEPDGEQTSGPKPKLVDRLKARAAKKKETTK